MLPASRRALGPALGTSVIAAIIPFYVASLSSRPSGEALVSRAALLNVLALLVAFFVTTVAHEGGHAAVAKAVGLRVAALYVGRGPVVWQRNVGDGVLALQGLPFTGATYVTAPSARWLRLRLAAVYAAGPLTNLALAFAATPLLGDDSALADLGSRPAPLLAFVVANWALVVFSAIPAPPRKGTLGSDGWNFLAMPFRKQRSLDGPVVAHAVWEARTLLVAGRVPEAKEAVASAIARDPSAPLARLVQSDLLVLQGHWPDAAIALRALLKDAGLRAAHPDAWPMLANNLAWADFAMNQADLLDEADHYSSLAYAARPDVPAINGTRGAVLLARGALDEAEARLAFAFERNPPPNKALNACCMAMLYVRRGDRATADKWLARARELSPKCTLLARAESAVAACGERGQPAAAEAS